MDTITAAHATSYEVLERFLASYWTTRTRENYRCILTRWLDWCHTRGYDPVGGADAAALETFIAELKTAGYAPNTIAGHSSCLDFDGIEIVRQDAGRVEIQAFVQYSGAEGCTDDWVTESVTVELEEPLSDRELIGCADDVIDWHGWNLDPDTDCSQTHDEHL